MALFEGDEKTEARPVLDGGIYGPGLDNEARVELTEFLVPDENGQLINAKGMNMAPGYDKEMTDGPYFYWNFKVQLANGATFFARAHTGSRTGRGWLRNAGVALQDDPNNSTRYSFDPADVAPRELKGGVELKPTRKGTGDFSDRTFQGDVKMVFAA